MSAKSASILGKPQTVQSPEQQYNSSHKLLRVPFYFVMQLFEYWLHPKRYRTEMCQFGAACTRPVCFFAHGEHQLRQTDMPGGPQPVVAPPEPVPALNGGFGSRDLGSPIDPAVKQQQQLMALQAAAAGFSHQQQQQQQHQQQQAAAVAAAAAASNMDPMAGGGLHQVSNYQGMVDTSSAMGQGMNGMAGGMGMGMGMAPLQGHLGLSSSSPLSAPLPQLSPDVLAALQSMGNGSGGGVSHMGNPLIHQHSALPAHFAEAQLPPPRPLQRSLTAHPAVNAAAAAAAAANDNSSNLNELTKHLALMQLMQGQPGTNEASGTLPDLNPQSMDHLLGFAQLQQQQQQHQQAAVAAAAAAAVTAGLDLGHLLPVSSTYGQPSDSSLSCPLPPVFGNSALACNVGTGGLPTLVHMGPALVHSSSLPRVPTAPGSTIGAPMSPLGSDNGRDAPSPVGANGRDTQVPAPGKKGHRWSAPVSPTNSAKGGNDVAAAADGMKLTGLNNAAGQQHSSSDSISTSSAAGGSNSRLHSYPSDNLARGLSGGLSPAPPQGSDVSFSAGLGAGPLTTASGAGGSGSSTDQTSALLMVGDQPLQACHVHAAMSGSLEGGQQQQQAQHSGIGTEKAAQLLGQLDESAVQKLLALVQQSGSA